MSSDSGPKRDHLDDARRRLQAASASLSEFRRMSGAAAETGEGSEAACVGLRAALRQARQALDERAREAEGLRRRLAQWELICSRKDAAGPDEAALDSAALAERARQAEADSARILRATAEETAALKGRLTLLQAEIVRVDSLRRKAEESVRQAEESKRSLEEALRRELREANGAIDRAAAEAGAREARAQSEVQAVQRRMEAALSRIEMLEREWRVEREKSRAERERLAASLQRAAAVHAALRRELREANARQPPGA